ncbi:Conserved_hypothetical protein [Hexamita inflata]|uniref:Uncharacterized protein n=1 Tax=Hexamita inflata TaxID=28002 RepID=A0AA86UH73_9EUKA|nr:Conserved hypothetical protein [Hexamita inflata]
MASFQNNQILHSQRYINQTTHFINRMCYLTDCPKCQKTTWGGCGAHLNGLFNGVKPENICKCDNGKPRRE